MYFWKTRLLAEHLKQNLLAEDHFKNYYLASTIFNVVFMYVAMLLSRENMLLLIVEAFAVLIVTVLGIKVAFKANGGVLGTRFMEKVVSLSFPLLIKTLVVSVVVGVAIGLGALSGVERTYLEWANAISVVAIQILFYWRLTTHIKYVNA